MHVIYFINNYSNPINDTVRVCLTKEQNDYKEKSIIFLAKTIFMEFECRLVVC